jgi:hypothetical protein
MAKIKEALALLRDYYTNPFNYRYEQEYNDDRPRVDSYGNLRGRVKPLSDVMSESGFPELGHGHFSVVFQVTDELVLKVNCNIDDKSYARYIDWCTKHQSNPYVPRVYYRTEIGSTRVYLLERLEPADSYQKVAQAIPSLHNLVRAGLPIKIECPHIAELMTYAENFHDCRGDNIMMRGTQPVFSDPCS